MMVCADHNDFCVVNYFLQYRDVAFMGHITHFFSSGPSYVITITTIIITLHKINDKIMIFLFYYMK